DRPPDTASCCQPMIIRPEPRPSVVECVLEGRCRGAMGPARAHRPHRSRSWQVFFVCSVVFVSLVPCVFVVPFVAPVHGSQQAPVFRAGIDLVNIGVTVNDKKGRLTTGLTAEDFELFEDGAKQRIQYFTRGDASLGEPGAAIHLGLLLDVSESMGE